MGDFFFYCRSATRQWDNHLYTRGAGSGQRDGCEIEVHLHLHSPGVSSVCGSVLELQALELRPGWVGVYQLCVFSMACVCFCWCHCCRLKQGSDLDLTVPVDWEHGSIPEWTAAVDFDRSVKATNHIVVLCTQDKCLDKFLQIPQSPVYWNCVTWSFRLQVFNPKITTFILV